MDIEKFRLSAARKKKSLSKFLDKLDEIVPHDMPVLVARLDGEMWKEVNCTECANCCKTMTPTFTPADVKRISAHLGMKAKDFSAKWLKKEEDSEDWVNITQPCQFLEDNKCSIYEVRPADCAEFPHHNKKPFDAYNETFKNNLIHCPATLNLVDRMKKIVEKEYEW
jgi:Fe-S-cluster containining protein